jgi:hypothetical protein
MLSGFYALFPERLDTIVRPIGGTTWRVASRFYSLSDEDIQECISRSGKLLRGAMPGDRCRFTVLTIAAGSELQNAAAVTRIREALAQIGIKKTRLCRASGSDDWQIFIWWSEWIDTNELQQKFVDWMAQVHLDPLFVFPGTRPLPLPLQSGFAWLDDQAALVTVREDLSLDQALELFFKDMSGGVNDWTIVSERIAALSKTLPRRQDELAQVADQVVESPSPEHQETAAESSNSAANEESVDEILDFAPPTGEDQKIISDIEPSCNTDISTQDLLVSVNIETSQPELSEPIEYVVAFKSDPIVPKAFIDPKGTDRESVVVPEEIAACESMQQLSLFPLEPLERGPPP